MNGRTWGIGTWILILAATIGCGKKGPPLPPFVRVPAAVGQLAAHRIGDDVVVTFALPVQNVDESTPVSLARVDVYAYTARTAPPIARFTQVARVVGQIDTTSPPPGVQTVRDTLTPEKLAEGPPLPTLSTAAPPLTSPSRDQSRVPLKRFYIAIPFSDRGRPGPPTPIIEVPLTALPDAPAGLRTTYTADAVTLRWDPSGGIVGFLLDVSALPGASPLDDGPPVAEPGTLPPGPTRYMVYREAVQEPESKETEEKNEDNKEENKAAAPVRKTPINPMPIDGLSFRDPLPRGDNNRRCYTVSALRGGRERGVEGHPSMVECMTPVDIFPPARPTGVSPIAVEGAVSLVWEANSEPDLQGYLVFRGEEGTDMLTRITDEPVKATRYTDQNVKPGVRYVYAVVAVDTQNPPNASPQSERVEVTAR